MSWPVAFIVLLAAGVLMMTLLLIRARREVSRAGLRIADLQKQLETMELTFGRFAPPELVSRIAEEGSNIQAERREVTVLFADIRGFTALSERLDPVVLVEMLNRYFHRMSEAISAEHGVVSKFIGDGLMATFGSIRPNAWQAADATRAALAMRKSLAELNSDLRNRGMEPISIGIGIHKGEVIAGVTGSRQLLEYTVLGDVVNVASRIESLTKEFGVDILISDAVKTGLGDRFELQVMDPARVKGKTRAIHTWAVVG
jgi:class 3 adenylate cyclase